MYCRKIITLFIFLGLTLSQAQANQLERFLQSTSTYEVDLEQRTFSADHKTFGLIKGKLYLNRPGKMRWENYTPEKQTIIADGRFIWSYKDDINQVSSLSQNMALKGTPAEILINPNSLKSLYKVVKLSNDFYKLTPKTSEGEFKWISITFKYNNIKSIDMENKKGQWINLKFSNHKKNRYIDNKLFVFDDGSDDDMDF